MSLFRVQSTESERKGYISAKKRTLKSFEIETLLPSGKEGFFACGGSFINNSQTERH